LPKFAKMIFLDPGESIGGHPTCINDSKNVDCTSLSENLKKGQTFDSFEEMKNTLWSLSESTYQLFSVSESKKIKLCDNSLIYERVVFCCKNGIRRRERGSGKRPQQTYFGQGCLAKIVVSLDSQIKKLVVSSSNFVHNHVVSEHLAKFFPCNRRLDKNMISQIVEADSFQANRKLLAENFRLKYDKRITARDVSNVLAKNRNIKHLNEVHDVSCLLDSWKSKDADASIKFISDAKSSEVDLIFFQSSRMRSSYSCFPEVIQIDGTYRLNSCGYVLYLFTNIDNNGVSQIVGWAFLSSETKENVDLCFQEFQNSNESLDDTLVVLVDKDFESVQLAHQFFQNATVLLCRVHVWRNFQRIVNETVFSKEELKLIATKRISIESIKIFLTRQLKQMLLTPLVKKFHELWVEIRDNTCIPAEFRTNFEANWFACRTMWANCYRRKLPTFGVNDTNRVEAQNKNIKDIIPKNSTMYECVKNLLSFCDIHSFNIDYRTFLSTCKTNVMQDGDDFKRFAAKHFSNFGIKILFQQYRSFKNQLEDQSIVVFMREKVAIVKSGKTESQVSGKSFSVCTCDNFCQSGLPCKHVFHVRSHFHLSLIDLDTDSKRFRRNICQLSVDGENRSVTFSKSNVVFERKVSEQIIPKTVSEKFCAAKKLLLEIGSIMSEMSMPLFDEQMKFLLAYKDRLNGKTENDQKSEKSAVTLIETNTVTASSKALKEHETEIDSSKNLQFRKRRRIIGRVRGMNAPQRSFKRRKILDGPKLTSTDLKFLHSSEFIDSSVIDKYTSLLRSTFNIDYPICLSEIFHESLNWKHRTDFVQIVPWKSSHVTLAKTGPCSFHLFCGENLNLNFCETSQSDLVPIFDVASSLSDSLSERFVHIEQWSCTESSFPKEQSLIALACAVDLCSGKNPSTKVHKLGNSITDNLIRSFDRGYVTCFDASKSVTRSSCLGKIPVRLFCICKKPYRGEEMLECSQCLEWYHPDCVKVKRSDDVYRKKSLPWFCVACRNNVSSKNLASTLLEDLKLFPNGFVITEKNVTYRAFNTCALDSLLMPFHAKNVETKGSLEKTFKLHENIAVRTLGNVLTLCRLKFTDDARLFWLRFIKLPSPDNTFNAFGCVYSSFLKHFEGTLGIEFSSTCSNNNCVVKESAELKTFLNFNDLVTLDMTFSSVQSALETLLSGYQGKCSKLMHFKDLGSELEVLPHCSGLRKIHASCIGELPPFILVPVGDLQKCESISLSKKVTIFSQTYELIGAVFDNRSIGHFTSSFYFHHQLCFYDDLKRNLTFEGWTVPPYWLIYLKS